MPLKEWLINYWCVFYSKKNLTFLCFKINFTVGIVLFSHAKHNLLNITPSKSVLMNSFT